MKPRILCAECQAQLSWGDRFCGNCGAEAEWPSGGGGERGNLRAEKRMGKDSPKRSAKPASWKMIGALAVFLIGGVVVLELLTGNREMPAVQSGNAGGTAANMQALQHLEELEKKADANPKDPKARLELANHLHDNRFYDKAITAYKKYLEMSPDDPDALVDLGICLNDLGNTEEAAQWMKKALRTSPKHLLAHFNLGIVSLKAGDLQEANEWFKKTVALSPESEIGKRAQELLKQHPS